MPMEYSRVWSHRRRVIMMKKCIVFVYSERKGERIHDMLRLYIDALAMVPAEPQEER